MKKLIIASLFVASTALAEGFQVPALSPNAKVSQTIGLTDVTIEYSSPGVRGRKVWGELVPYDKVWRAGANGTTKITFSHPVTIGTTAVPAGSYGLFVIPQAKGNWVVIINKELDWGSYNYKKEQDLVRIEVKPEATAMSERLTYSFPDFDNNSATLAIAWEKVRLNVPVKLQTDVQVAEGIKNMMDGEWRTYNQAARYELEQKKDYEMGLKLVDQSITRKEQWFNVWTKAQLLAAKGDYKAAYPLAQKANELGEKDPQNFFYADNVKAALKDWKAKS